MIMNNKKYIFLSMVVLLTSLIVLIPNYNYSFASYIMPNSEATFYTTSPLKSVPNYLTQTNIGVGAMIECSGSIAPKVAKTLNNIAGISFQFNGGQNDIEEFLDKVDAVVLKCETIDNSIKTYLAYAPKLRNNIKVDNMTVNLQIAVVDSTITIGSPMILGEY